MAGNMAPPVHRIIEPAPVRVTQQHVVLAVLVEVTDAGNLPVQFAGQVGQAALTGNMAAPVHRIVEPAPVLVAQQHVVLAVLVEVTDAGNLPVQFAGEVGQASLAGNMAPPVHRIVEPAPVLVAQQHVVLAVLVEVTENRRRTNTAFVCVGCSKRHYTTEQRRQYAQTPPSCEHGAYPVSVPGQAPHPGTSILLV